MPRYRVNVQVLHSFEVDAPGEDEAEDVVMGYCQKQWNDSSHDITVEEVEEIKD